MSEAAEEGSAEEGTTARARAGAAEPAAGEAGSAAAARGRAARAEHSEGEAGLAADGSLAAAAALVDARLGTIPRTAIVLGSGLGHLCERLDDARTVAFEDLPGFPAPRVVGHAGRFVAGRLDGVEVLVQAGRYHLYEGHPLSTVVAPVRLAARLGVRTVVFTNAAGGVEPSLKPGDLVRVADHVDLTFQRPLQGSLTPASRPQQTSYARTCASPYDADIGRLADEAAADIGSNLRSGVYGGVLGPSFETPAEVRMLRVMGVDVVGMSTVSEVLAARAVGMRRAAFSVVTNQAAGLGAKAPLDHAEVLEVGRRAGEGLWRLMSALVRRLDGPSQPGDAK